MSREDYYSEDVSLDVLIQRVIRIFNYLDEDITIHYLYLEKLIYNLLV